MQLKISLKQLNKEYSMKLAKELQHDPESIANPKYLLEASMPHYIEVDDFVIKKDQTFTVNRKPSDNKKDVMFSNMLLFQGIKDGKVEFCIAVSKDLIERNKNFPNSSSNKTHHCIYLKRS